MLSEVTYEDGTVEYLEHVFSCAEDLENKSRGCRVVGLNDSCGAYYLVKINNRWHLYEPDSGALFLLFWNTECGHNDLGKIEVWAAQAVRERIANTIGSMFNAL